MNLANGYHVLDNELNFEHTIPNKMDMAPCCHGAHHGLSKNLPIFYFVRVNVGEYSTTIIFIFSTIAIKMSF